MTCTDIRYKNNYGHYIPVKFWRIRHWA